MKRLIFSRKKRLCEYHRRTVTVPRFKNKKINIGASCVRTVRVPYEYQYPRSIGTDTFCKLEYPCFRDFQSKIVISIRPKMWHNWQALRHDLGSAKRRNSKLWTIMTWFVSTVGVILLLSVVTHKINEGSVATQRNRSEQFH